MSSKQQQMSDVQPPATFYVTGCDRCGHRGWSVQVREDLPCCQVPLCDPCAELHRIEVAEEQEYDQAARREETNHGD